MSTYRNRGSYEGGILPNYDSGESQKDRQYETLLSQKGSNSESEKPVRRNTTERGYLVDLRVGLVQQRASIDAQIADIDSQLRRLDRYELNN